MEKPEALFLADELEAPLGTVIGAELYRRAAKELRRLHAQRDALLEALRWIDRRCPEPNWADVEPHRIHFEMAHDAGACARAAIATVEETK